MRPGRCALIASATLLQAPPRCAGGGWGYGVLRRARVTSLVLRRELRGTPVTTRTPSRAGPAPPRTCTAPRTPTPRAPARVQDPSHGRSHGRAHGAAVPAEL